MNYISNNFIEIYDKNESTIKQINVKIIEEVFYY
jgi:hypothetical protein